MTDPITSFVKNSFSQVERGVADAVQAVSQVLGLSPAAKTRLVNFAKSQSAQVAVDAAILATRDTTGQAWQESITKLNSARSSRNADKTEGAMELAGILDQAYAQSLFNQTIAGGSLAPTAAGGAPGGVQAAAGKAARLDDAFIQIDDVRQTMGDDHPMALELAKVHEIYAARRAEIIQSAARPQSV